MKNVEISNLTINATMKCNMRCSYCYVFSQETDNCSLNEELSVDDIKLILEQYVRYQRSYGKQYVVDVTWHGGEPLLKGLNFFEQILEVERNLYDKYHVLVRNRIQTNGTLINQKWAKFFSKNKISVGISIDGPEKIYSQHRYYSNKSSAFLDMMNGIQVLQSHSIPFGVLSVITNETYNDYYIIYKFMKHLGVEFVDFIPSYLPCKLGEGIKSKNWASFLINMYNCWIKDLSFNIGYFSDIIRKMNCLLKYDDYHNYPLLCELTDECGHNLSITSDGDLYMCECLVGMADYKIGNVLNESMYDLLSTNGMILNKMNNLSQDCINCKFLSLCEGGCLKHRIMDGNLSHNSKDYFCVAKKAIFSHIWKDLFEKKANKTVFNV